VTILSEAPKVRPLAQTAVVFGALALLATAVLTGGSVRLTAALVIAATVGALVRPAMLSWPRLIATLIVIILFIPIRRYTLPASLPFQLEPYRVFVALLVLGWIASLLVDSRTRIRRTGFEGPIALIVGAVLVSLAANPGRVAGAPSVNKSLMFFMSYILVFFLIVSTVRRIDEVDFLAKTLVASGAVVAVFAVIEARTGFNVFNHLSRVIPLLHGGEIAGAEFTRVGTGRLRVFGSAEHPIALSAALVMLTPLALYLGRRYRQRRWWACALVLIVACASTVSRTGIVMFLAVAVVFVILRPREARRFWPAIIPALLVIHVALPGTLGSIKNSFAPPGGLVKEQTDQAVGSGRLASLGPGLHEWKQQPLFGEGYATRLAPSSSPQGGPQGGQQGFILDDQWLSTLIETGVVGFFAWLWFFGRAIRRFGREAKEDSDRGWLLTSIVASIAAYAVGMLTYDSFGFAQVTFLLFILVALGASLLAEAPVPRLVGSSAGEPDGARLATRS
jgi:O-antigen ligase